jgi:hypothetical protein
MKSISHEKQIEIASAFVATLHERFYGEGMSDLGMLRAARKKMVHPWGSVLSLLIIYWLVAHEFPTIWHWYAIILLVTLAFWEFWRYRRLLRRLELTEDIFFAGAPISLAEVIARNSKTEPNQAPEPTPTTVTPPAGQEARQP